MKIKVEAIIRTLEQYSDDEIRDLTDEMSFHRVWLNDQELDLKKSLALENKSPSGFNWGYAGSGPSQLALAICLELFGEGRAKKVYQKFKHTFVAVWPLEQDFCLVIEIQDFVHQCADDFEAADTEAEEEIILQQENQGLEAEEIRYEEQSPESKRKKYSQAVDIQPDTLERLKLKSIRFSFKGPNKMTGWCDLIISEKNCIVIATEVANNPGVSLTNGAEYIARDVCQKFGLNPAKLLWIEHYSSRSYYAGRGSEEFDLVRFQTNPQGQLDAPEWFPLSQEEMESYLLLLNEEITS